MNGAKNPMMLVRGLTLAALILLVVSYFTPIWWVSLTAPNYPKEAFPDGIRIHFHFNGVFNGRPPKSPSNLSSARPPQHECTMHNLRLVISSHSSGVSVPFSKPMVNCSSLHSPCPKTTDAPSNDDFRWLMTSAT